MKKIVLTVLVAALLLLTFVGCAPKTFTVTFDTDGGSTVAAQTVKEGEKATRPANPTKTDFEFDNWYTAKTGGEVFDFDKEVTGDVTVYARWTAVSAKTVTFKVNYVAADGLDDSHDKSETVILQVGAALPSVSYDYIESRGYFTDQAMTTAFSGDKVTEDMPELWIKLDRKLTITEGQYVFTLREDNTTYAIAENAANKPSAAEVTLPLKGRTLRRDGCGKTRLYLLVVHQAYHTRGLHRYSRKRLLRQHFFGGGQFPLDAQSN